MFFFQCMDVECDNMFLGFRTQRLKRDPITVLNGRYSLLSVQAICFDLRLRSGNKKVRHNIRTVSTCLKSITCGRPYTAKRSGEKLLTIM